MFDFINFFTCVLMLFLATSLILIPTMKTNRLQLVRVSSVLSFALLITIFSFINSAYAQGTGDEVSSIIEAVTSLVKNWKALGTFGIASAGLALVIQVLKVSFLQGLFKSESSKLVKRMVVVVLGVVASVMVSFKSGMGWVDASVAGLITSGGAMAIYESFKAFKSSKKWIQ